jgi:hypothetical protein
MNLIGRKFKKKKKKNNKIQSNPKNPHPGRFFLKTRVFANPEWNSTGMVSNKI